MASLRASALPRRALGRPWIIADMDSTLLERPLSGLFPTLRDSPCFEPVLRWLRLGGGLCVVTTAACRAIDQVWDCVPAELRAHRSVVISTNGGGDLVCGGPDGEMVADEAYLSMGTPEGLPTGLPWAGVGVLVDYALQMLRSIFRGMQDDPTILHALSTKFQAPFSAILRRMAAGESVETVLSRPAVLTPGAIMTETGETLVSMNVPVSLAPEKWLALQEAFMASDLAAGGLPSAAQCPVCSLSVMGFPSSSAASRRFWEPVVLPAQQVGALLSNAPNSLLFTPIGVNKATPIRWLQRNADLYGFDLSNAVAMGDCPHSNDEPLTRLRLVPSEDACAGDRTCPFVSVAHDSNRHCLPAHVVGQHVGGLESGAACVISGLARAAGAAGASALSVADALPDVVRQCQSEAGKRESEQKQQEKEEKPAAGAAGAVDGRDAAA